MLSLLLNRTLLEKQNGSDELLAAGDEDINVSDIINILQLRR